jgi:hypothetical protein
MSNKYGISKRVEREIRERDKRCVYCGILMKQSPQARGASGITIEHFNNDGPFTKKYNLAICCRRCNSSKGTKGLCDWFEKSYCQEKKINKESVSEPVKEYMRRQKLICKTQALARLRKLRRPLPTGFVFGREEINTR